MRRKKKILKRILVMNNQSLFYIIRSFLNIYNCVVLDVVRLSENKILQKYYNRH